MIENGYYVVEDTARDGNRTVAKVDGNDVWLLEYTDGYTVEDVFGKNSKFKIIRGPSSI